MGCGLSCGPSRPLEECALRPISLATGQNELSTSLRGQLEASDRGVTRNMLSPGFPLLWLRLLSLLLAPPPLVNTINARVARVQSSAFPLSMPHAPKF